MGYTAFGTAYAPNTSVEVEQRYTYTGREQTTDPALMYYRWRIYAPTLGRFTARDPIDEKGSPDGGLYAYVQNKPLAWYDPYGEDTNSVNVGLSASAGAFIPTLPEPGIFGAGAGVEVSLSIYEVIQLSPKLKCQTCLSAAFTVVVGGGSISGTAGANVTAGVGGNQSSGPSTGHGAGGAAGYGGPHGGSGSVDYDSDSDTTQVTIGRLGPTLGVYGGYRRNFTCTACVDTFPLGTLSSRLGAETAKVIPPCYRAAAEAINPKPANRNKSLNN